MGKKRQLTPEEVTELFSEVDASGVIDPARVKTRKKRLMSWRATKRGIMDVAANKLYKITESKVTKKKNKIIASSLYSSNGKEIDENTLVSMNLLLFSPDIFDILTDELYLFLSLHQKNLDNYEFGIPDVLDTCLKKNIKTIDVINTSSIWYGMTYKEDKSFVVNALKEMTEEGLYPQKLWKNI